MAINIEWQLLPTQKKNIDGKPLLFPRMIENESINLNLLCEEIAKQSIHTKGTIKGVIYDLVEIFAKLLHEGKTIDLEDMGTFKLAIGTDAKITSDMPYKKRPITVRGINFQPSKILMDAIGTPKFRTIPRNAKLTAMSQEQLQKTLLEYFNKHDSITRLQFERLCQLKRATAYFHLKRFVESGFLIKIGNNRETRYIAGFIKTT